MTGRLLPSLAIAGLFCVVPAAWAQTPQFVVPSEFAAVTPFVRILETAGITIQRIEDGQQGRAYPNLRASAFLETNRGDVKIAVFASEAQTDRISITYMRDKRRGAHRYRLNGIATGTGLTVESGEPLYFTIDRAWLVETRDGAMDLLVKQALGQVRDGVESTSRAPR